MPSSDEFSEMPSSDEFSDATKNIYNMVREIGGEVESKIDGAIVDGREVQGYSCSLDDIFYHVYESPETKYFEILYEYTVASDVTAAYRDSDQNVDSEQKTLEIVESLDKETKNETRLELSRILSKPGLRHTYSVHEDAPVSFDILSKIFPYRDGFDVAEFNHSVVTITQAGLVGVQYLRHQYGISEKLFPQQEERSNDTGRSFI